MADGDDEFYEHVRPEDEAVEPPAFPDEPIRVPGFMGDGSGFLVDLADPDAVEKIRVALESEIDVARERHSQARAGQEQMMLRAARPGFFQWYLDTFAAHMPPSVKAEFVAQTALDRRITAIEGLLAEKLIRIDLTEGDPRGE